MIQKRSILLDTPFRVKNKSARRDSNPRPRPWQGRAPPTEPLAHVFCMLPCIEGIKLIICSSLRYFREAGDGNRTHVSSLEGWCSTIELHPHIFCPVWITRTNKIITENSVYVKIHYQFSVIMPRTGIEPVTRGFSVLCSTD